MNIRTAFITIIITLTILSCSDNSTTPTKEKDFFQMKAGNYWIYEVFELDGNSYPINKLGEDSIVVAKTNNINDRQGVELHIFRDLAIYDTLFFSVDGQSIYQYRDETTDSIPGFDEWLKIVDLSGDKWFMHRFSSYNYQFDFEDTTFTCDAQFVYNGFYNGTKKILIPSNLIEYETIYTSVKIDAKIEFDHIHDSIKTTFLMVQNNYTDYYLSDGIGLVMQTYRPSTRYINNQSINFNGWQRQLIRYEVAKD
jgi:hypothetical protein